MTHSPITESRAGGEGMTLAELCEAAVTRSDNTAGNLRALVLGHKLSRGSREQLTAWLVANKTGGAKLRAGVPKGWRVGDKTGGGDHATMNDVAIVWPTGREPLIVSVFMTETSASFDVRNAAIAQIGRALSNALDTAASRPASARRR